jgi:hypothetical protein
MKPAAFLACAVAAAGMLAAVYAMAQDKGPDLGDHDWIQAEPSYRSSSGAVHCCDRSQCHPLNDADVIEQDGGWLFKPTGQHFREGDPGVYTSKEWRYYGCGNATRLWCFFIKPGGV